LRAARIVVFDQHDVHLAGVGRTRRTVYVRIAGLCSAGMATHRAYQAPSAGSVPLRSGKQLPG